MKLISWDVIADAVAFYKARGYNYVETPWTTDIDTLMITCPYRDNIFVVDNSVGLVGSAEQGFLEMVRNEELQLDVQYVSAGPCFRDEPADELHQQSFFKVELFYFTKDQDRAAAQAKEMLQHAYSFMLLRSTARPTIVDVGFGWDININDIEVGSYGFRYHEEIGFWAYGTGVAEPRFSLATLK